MTEWNLTIHNHFSFYRKTPSKELHEDFKGSSDPHLSEQPQNLVAPEADPNRMVYTSMYPTPQTLGAKAQDALAQLDLQMRSLTQNLDQDLRMKYSTQSPTLGQWNYAYGVAINLHRIVQNLKAFNAASLGFMDPGGMMQQYPPSTAPMMYAPQNDGYMQYGQVAYMMQPTDMNSHTPI